MNDTPRWKAGFDAWEKATSAFLETWLKSPLVLEPAGAALSGAMKLKSFGDRVAAEWWGAIGLPTKRDQERTLHTLFQLESRILDLEEKLEKREG